MLSINLFSWDWLCYCCWLGCLGIKHLTVGSRLSALFLKSFFILELTPTSKLGILSVTCFCLFKHILMPCWLSWVGQLSIVSELCFQSLKTRGRRQWGHLVLDHPSHHFLFSIVLSNRRHWDSWSAGWKSIKCHQSPFQTRSVALCPWSAFNQHMWKGPNMCLPW